MRVGAPVWSCPGWVDNVYPRGTPRKRWLHWYTRHFNTVEGNSTFYALPSREVFRQWAEQSVPGFQFCLKVPRVISHERELLHCDDQLREFCDRLAILAEADRLGPTFLQLGPRFGPDRLGVLRRFLSTLPSEFPWAVEVRHPEWFGPESQCRATSASNTATVSMVDPQHWSDAETQLHELLASHRIDRVIFDSRALFQLPADDPVEVASQQRKPRLPVRPMVCGARPMIRLVGRNRVELTQRFLNGWSPLLCDWIAQGLHPIVFLHTPDDRFAPALARQFLRSMRHEAASSEGECEINSQKQDSDSEPDSSACCWRSPNLADLQATGTADDQPRLFL